MVGDERGFISAPRDAGARGAELRLAAARGFRYLQVDASSNSAPILRRLGFQPIATTTPYVWAPPS